MGIIKEMFATCPVDSHAYQSINEQYDDCIRYWNPAAFTIQLDVVLTLESLKIQNREKAEIMYDFSFFHNLKTSRIQNEDN
jgi:hypothetical protein